MCIHLRNGHVWRLLWCVVGVTLTRLSLHILVLGISNTNIEIFCYVEKKNCLEIQLYGWELDYPIFLLQKFKVNWTTSARSYDIWPFTLWVGQPWYFCKLSTWCHLWSRVTFWKVCNMAILHNVLVKMVAPKNLDCIGEFRWGPMCSKFNHLKFPRTKFPTPNFPNIVHT